MSLWQEIQATHLMYENQTILLWYKNRCESLIHLWELKKISLVKHLAHHSKNNWLMSAKRGLLFYYVKLTWDFV